MNEKIAKEVSYGIKTFFWFMSNYFLLYFVFMSITNQHGSLWWWINLFMAIHIKIFMYKFEDRVK